MVMITDDMIYEYDNSADLLNFIKDVAITNSRADYNDDKVWREEFKFIVEQIDGFLKEKEEK